MPEVAAMVPTPVKPVRVKIYGFLWMTKRTYLMVERVGFAVILFLLAVGAVAMVQEGRWLPDLDLARQGVTNAWIVRQALIGFFWLALLVGVLEGIEVFVVLRMFAREEARERARQAVLDTTPSPPPAGAEPPALQPPVTNPET
jgi:hypothetical protein